MKKHYLLTLGLCGAICFGFVGVHSALAQTDSSSRGAETSKSEETTEDILFNNINGGQISTDGETWTSQSEYELSNNTPETEWWTADEYEKWMNEQKQELESLVGSGNGWYDGQDNFHEFTQEYVDSIISDYLKTLDEIKKGYKYSKNTGTEDTFFMVPPSEEVVSDYGVNVIKDNNETVQFNNYSSNEELDKAIDAAKKNGQLTKEEADGARTQ